MGLAVAWFAISHAWTMLGSDERATSSATTPKSRKITSAAVSAPASAVASGGRGLVQDLARFSPQLYRIMQATEQAHAEVEQLQRRNQKSSSASL
jgi:hypothetical protein